MRQNLVAIGGIADIERFSAGNDLQRLTLNGPAQVAQCIPQRLIQRKTVNCLSLKPPPPRMPIIAKVLVAPTLSPSSPHLVGNSN